MTEKIVRVPKKLLDRMRGERSLAKKQHERASSWQGEYGYGAGRAPPCVEFATCPHCAQPPGKLCIGARGPHLSVHFLRSRAYRDLRRAVRERLARESLGGGVRE